MNAKMKACFTPHALTHSLMGLGLGIILVSLVPSLNSLMIGLGAVAVAIVLDFLRKE